MEAGQPGLPGPSVTHIVAREPRKDSEYVTIPHQILLGTFVEGTQKRPLPVESFVKLMEVGPAGQNGQPAILSVHITG